MSEVDTFYKEVKFLKQKYNIDNHCSIYEFAANLIKENKRLEDEIVKLSQKRRSEMSEPNIIEINEPVVETKKRRIYD
jgi:hypothetical protein